MRNRAETYQTAALVLCISVAIGIALNLHFRSLSVNTREWADTYYTWVEGKRILAGENPYARVLAGDMRENDKYATYFPLLYLLSAASQWAGLRDYGPWIFFWRQVFFLFTLAVGFLIFHVLHQRRGPVVALLGFLLWLFNRWTLTSLMAAHPESLPIFFLLLSVLVFPKRPRTALLLFGVSLALKQIAIFAVPLYLIWVWHDSKGSLRRVLSAAAALAAVPLLLSLPFLLWNAEGYLKSICFSATRYPLVYSGANSVDILLGLQGPAARLPMLALMGLVYLAAWRRRVGPFTGVFLVQFLFAAMNTVHFPQYVCWMIAPLLAALGDDLTWLPESGERRLLRSQK
jgi:uncharacterized membrane protein